MENYQEWFLVSCRGYLDKKEWITEETWARVEQRAKIIAKLLSLRSERIRERIKKDYDAKNKEVDERKKTRQESFR